MTNGNTPVYPIQEAYEQDWVANGLTKREYFAAMAMQGMLGGLGGQGNFSYTNIAEESVRYADALIEALNKK